MIEQQISPYAKKVIQKLNKAGFKGYLVGGGVRDCLLGVTPKDFDVVTNARPEEIKSVFSNCRLIGRRFRLAHIYFGDYIIEVATFRSANDLEDTGIVRQDNVYGDSLARILFQHGYPVEFEKTLPDTESILLEHLKQSLKQAKILLITGGLGPTHDDKTREVIATLVHQKLILHPGLYAELKKRYAHVQDSALKNQATIIKDAEILPNPLGTAPGLRINFKTQTLILLPGVPREMQYLLENGLLPWLKQAHPLKSGTLVVKLNFCHLSEGTIHQKIQSLSNAYAGIKIGVYPDLSLIRIVLICKETEKKALETLKNKLITLYHKHYFGEGQQDLAKIVLKLAHEKGILFLLEEHFSAGILATKLILADPSLKNFSGSVVAEKRSGCVVHPQNSWQVLISNRENDLVTLSIFQGQKKLNENTLPANQDSESLRIRSAHQMLALLLLTLNHF